MGRGLMSRFDLIVLDFDGTFTDVEKEADPFFAAYRGQVEEQFGDVKADWAEAEATIAKDPAHYGWSYGGHVVAPGNADPYLRATVIMNMVFEQRGLFPDMDERTEVLQRLYFENYPKADTVFRPEAKDVVETLLRGDTPVFVVTNSATHDVQQKLNTLAPVGREKLTVHGDARKYIVNEPEVSSPAFEAVPKTMEVEGLRRPILLRRGDYFTMLTSLWKQTGATPERTFVAGDIFELDLAMPAVLGASVHLVLKERTAPFEKTAVEQVGGQYSETLTPILERLGY